MSCERTRNIEAMRDGLLPEKARLDLELHVHECADCAAEDRALGSLQARLRMGTADAADPAALRRLRAKLLAEPRATRPSRGWLLPAAAAMAFAVWRLAPTGGAAPKAPEAVTAAPTTRVDATDEGGARWSASDDGPLRRIDLLEGSLALRIDRPAGGHRVVVRVPDGEIEDVGTEFHVEVTDGHTKAVRVDHGSVVIRLEGSAPRALHAGESWTRPSPPPVQSTAPRPGPPTRAPVVASASASAIDDGEEDRAYVEIVRLLRENRTAEAQLAANRYVQRFPNGFRRAEVQRVLER